MKPYETSEVGDFNAQELRMMEGAIRYFSITTEQALRDAITAQEPQRIRLHRMELEALKKLLGKLESSRRVAPVRAVPLESSPG